MPLRRKGRNKDSEKKNGPRTADRFDSRRAGLAAATTAILSVLLCWHFLPEKVSLEVGDRSSEDIRAHRSVRYLDSRETARRRLESAYAVDKVYDFVPYARQQALGTVQEFFAVVSQAMSSGALRSLEAKTAFVRSEVGSGISESTISAMLQSRPRELAGAGRFCANTVGSIMRQPLRDDADDLDRARAAVDIAAGRAFGSSRHAFALAEICKSALSPTRIYDAERTALLRKAAEREVRPVYGEIIAGQTVVHRGERVTASHVDKFRALGLRHPKLDVRSALSLIAYAAFMVLLVSLYLARYQPRVYDTPKLLLLLSLVVVLSATALKLGGALLGIQLSGLQLAYVGTLSVTVAGMVLAILLNVEIAVVLVVLLALSTGFVMSSELKYAAMTLVSGLVGVYGVSNIRTRGDLIRCGAAIALANTGMVWIIGGLSDDTVGSMASGTGWSVAIGVFSVTLFFFGAAILEKLFDITTHISLMELADSNKPILQRMQEEATGTFAHSVAVGQLADAAAQEIGADALLARVASYYHDIGKLLRPHFFMENQFASNVHDGMNPTLSALVITSHVKDGIELAKEHRLPTVIQDVISQHHGTSLVHYFYSLVATDEEGRSAVLEQQFRYTGPKPQSREAAIVMLADSVEAASRALDKPTPATIEDMVRRIIADKRKDGQLDESDLTHKDLDRIAGAFTRRRIAALHARIEYPEPPGAADGKKQSESGDTVSQLSEDAPAEDEAAVAGAAAPGGRKGARVRRA